MEHTLPTGQDDVRMADYWSHELTPPQKTAMAHIIGGHDPMSFAHTRGMRGATRRVLSRLERAELIGWRTVGSIGGGWRTTPLGDLTWSRLLADDGRRTAALVVAAGACA